MTHRALRLYMILAASLVIVGMLTQSFAQSGLIGNPDMSYWAFDWAHDPAYGRAYGIGLGWGIVGWIAVSRLADFRLWVSAPIWVGALLATVGSVLLSFSVTTDEGGRSGLLALIPMFCWAGVIEDRQEAQRTELSEPLTLVILCAWGIAMPFPASLFGLAFLALTTRRSPVWRAVVNANIFIVLFTAIAIAISPYRQSMFLRWIGFDDELPWEYLRERVLAHLNSSGTHVVLPDAYGIFLLTSLVEWQGYLLGLIVGATAVGLPVWAIYEFSRMRGGGWQRIFGLGLAACLLPFACLSLLSNFGLALTHLHGLIFFAPDIVFLIYATMLVATLFATRSESGHQPQLE